MNALLPIFEFSTFVSNQELHQLNENFQACFVRVSLADLRKSSTAGIDPGQPDDHQRDGLLGAQRQGNR